MTKSHSNYYTRGEANILIMGELTMDICQSQGGLKPKPLASAQVLTLAEDVYAESSAHTNPKRKITQTGKDAMAIYIYYA